MGKWGCMWEDVEVFCMVCMELPLYLTISKKNILYSSKCTEYFVLNTV